MPRRAGPPRAAMALIGRLIPPELRDEVTGDLELLWAQKNRTRGRWRADLWCWGQLFRAAGSRTRSGKYTREKGEAGMMDSMKRDVGYALSQLRRHPGIGLVVVTTLAIGIGATTAIFSAVHGVLLSPLPFEDPSELVMISAETSGQSEPRNLSAPDFLDMGAQLTSVADLAFLLEATVGPMTGVDRPEHVLTAPVTWNLFSLLGVDMAAGRSFNADDAARTALEGQVAPPQAGVISHDFWVRSFGADPDVLGTVVDVWGGPTEIVGILPAGFRMDLPPELNIPPKGDIWRAIAGDLTTWSRESAVARTVGRLTPGATLRSVREELITFGAEARRIHPAHGAEGTAFRAESVEAAVAGPMKGPLWLLMGAVTLVLLIACANVANLLLARGATRAGEMAVRASLGADSGRLMRQLLTESAVMAGLGAAGGAVLAVGGVRLLHAIRPQDLHRLEAVQLDGVTLGFAILVAVAVTLLAGFLPAWQTASSGLARHLKVRGGARAGHRSRRALVVAEVALSVVLLVGAGLMIRTFTELQEMSLGFEPEGVMTATATQSPRPREDRQAYEAELVRAVAAVPGVASAGIVFPLPMNGIYERTAEYAMDGREQDPTAWTSAYFRTISPEYFDVMGIRLLAGRQFVSVDEDPDAPVVIIDEKLAAREFEGVDPVGRPLWVRGMGGDTLNARIVGVAAHVPQGDHRDVRPTMYFPRVLYQSHEVAVVARTTGSASVTTPLIAAAIRGVDPSFPSDLTPMSSFVSERLARSRFLLILMQIFGALALALAGVGLYSVLAYSVRQQRREIGLRLALGAGGLGVTRRVVAQGLELAGIGVGLGLLGALVMGRALQAQLFQVGAADPVTLILAGLLALVVAGGASLLPAVRAARVDPMVSMQEE